MKALKVPLIKAEKIKKILIEKDLFLKGYKHIKNKTHIFFPVKKKLEGFEVQDKEFELSKKIPDLKTALEKDLSIEELKLLKTAFDVVGDIAILEIDDKLRNKEFLIAKKLLETNKNIKTVLRKEDKHKGEFRTQNMKFLEGENKKISIHKEHSIKIKVDVEKVYFSPRLSNERLRISNLIKKDEKVLVLFSGCAPYPLVISKNTLAKKIVGVEHNPLGHEFGLQNIKLNNLNNIHLYCLDAKEFKGDFDRVIMPAPDNAFNFLENISNYLTNGWVHIYTFARKEDYNDLKNKILKVIPSAKNFGFFTCGSHAPGVFRICVDFRI